MSLPLHYRCLGWADWVTGTTLNVSRTGLLIHGAERPANGAAVELWMDVPGPQAHLSRRVLCAGTVVRTENQNCFAVKFADYELALPEALTA